MPISPETQKARQKVARAARKAAKDLLQYADYIEDGRLTYAAYNLRQVKKRLQITEKYYKNL